MIYNDDELVNGEIIEADICIVGSGAAGITLAMEFQNTNLKIVIVTGGDYRETIANQELNKGIVFPKGSHEPLEENRRRAFGGSTIAWGGRCIPLDASDFEIKEWIPYSGWPISYESLIPFYKKSMDLCKAGQFDFNSYTSFSNSKHQEIIHGIDNDELNSTSLERWSPPVNFSKEYQHILSGCSNLWVLLNAHVTNIETNNRKESVSSVSVIANGKGIQIHAKKYILACGGIENPRLLLSSVNSFHPNGIGNDHDVVGRYYMAHFAGIHIEVSPNDRKNMVFDFEKDSEGVDCRRRWRVTEKGQHNKKIGAAIFYLHNAKNQEGHRDALFSIVFISKFLLSLSKSHSLQKAKISWHKEKDEVIIHGKNILRNGWSEIPRVFKIAVKRLNKRRLPFVLPSVNSKSFGLYFQTEHMPNPESRITVTKTEVDSMGLPKAIVKVAFSEMDRKTILEAHEIFVERFQYAQAGEFKFDREELSKFIDEKVRHFNSGAHHLGTTRIAEDPKFGVVDADCKVHCMENLFIAGSSVFPTGGHANPTLTIVALAVRLSEHLKKEFQIV